MKLNNYEYDEKSTITLRDVPNAALMGAAELMDRMHHEDLAKLCHITGNESMRDKLIKIVSKLLTYTPETEYKRSLKDLNSSIEQLTSENLVKRLAQIKQEQKQKTEYLERIDAIHREFWQQVRTITIQTLKDGIYIHKLKGEEGKLFFLKEYVYYYPSPDSNSKLIYHDNNDIELHNIALNYISQNYDGKVGI